MKASTHAESSWNSFPPLSPLGAPHCPWSPGALGNELPLWGPSSCLGQTGPVQILVLPFIELVILVCFEFAELAMEPCRGNYPRSNPPDEGHHCPELSLPPAEQWQGQHGVAALSAAASRTRALASFSSQPQEPHRQCSVLGRTSDCSQTSGVTDEFCHLLRPRFPQL